MPPPFEPLLTALRELRETGPDGFEGLVRDALEFLGDCNIHLVKSGTQKGKDMLGQTRDGLMRVAIEAKRFAAKTSLALDEMKQKLTDAAENEDIDVWAIALSKEMVEPDWSEIRQIGEKRGIVTVALDWKSAPGTLPVLATLVANARSIVGQRLPSIPSRVWSEIEGHPQFDSVLKRLRSAMFQPGSGFSLARQAAYKWLTESLKNRDLAQQRLRGHVDVESNNVEFIDRTIPTSELDAWWADKSAGTAVLLGDEGRGKSWLVLKWLHRLAAADKAPMVLVISAKVLRSGTVPEMLSQALRQAIPAMSNSQLQARLTRWICQGDEPVVLLIDGLNEHFSIDWLDLVKSFETEPWKQPVRLLVTSRTQYWRDDVAGAQCLGSNRKEIEVPDYTDDELDAFLKSQRRKREELPQALLKLMRVPRLAALSLRVAESLKDQSDITVADLILADWRSRTSEVDRFIGVDEQALSDFITDLAREAKNNTEFQISTKEIHEKLSSDSGKNLDHYRDAISELVEGSWLEKADRPNRYRLNSKLLPYAIGLDLAIQLEAASSETQASEIIAPYIEQLRGADIGVNILRAACSLVVARNKAAHPVKKAAIEKWLAEQNFRGEDFQQFWPLVSRDISLFVDIAESHFKSPLRTTQITEVLIKALANANKWPGVHKGLVERLPHWAGAYRTDPIARGGKEGIPVSEDRVAATERRLAQWIDTPPVGLPDMARHLRADVSDYLAEAALGIISYIDRAPFVETLTTYALATAIMGDGRKINAFEWVLRRNEHDPAETEKALLESVTVLIAAGTPIGHDVAKVLAGALATSKAFSAVSEAGTEEETATSRPIRSKDNPLKALAHLERLASDPLVKLNSVDSKRLKQVREMAERGEVTLEALTSNIALAKVFSRWSASTLPRLIRTDWSDLATTYLAGTHPFPDFEITDLFFLLNKEQADQLYEMARGAEVSATDGQKASTLRLHKHNAALIAAAILPQQRQLPMLEVFDRAPGFSTNLIQLLDVPTDDELNALVGRIPEQAAVPWLDFIEKLRNKDTTIDADRLLEFVDSSDKAIRARAMILLLDCGSDRLKSAFGERDWRYKDSMDREEAVAGSFLLILSTPPLPISQLAARIMPELLAEAVARRGLVAEDVEFLSTRLIDRLNDELSSAHKTRTHMNVGRFPQEEIAIQAAVKSRPELLGLVDRVISKNKTFGFMRSFPVSDIIKAGIEVDPDLAAQVWRHTVQAYADMRYEDGDLTALAFAKTDAEAFVELRAHCLTTIKNDMELGDAVFNALEGSHENWLIDFARSQFSEVSAGRTALGLQIAGYLDDSPAAQTLWEEITKASLTGWLANVRAAAHICYQRNASAKYWLKEYAERNSDVDAFGAMKLFEDVFDSRTRLWSCAVLKEAQIESRARRRRYLQVRDDRLKELRKRRERDHKGTLYSTKTVGTVDPWY